jgi:hypothetical protein
MRAPAHVQSNVAASEHGTISTEVLRRLRKHRWVRNFYAPPGTLTDRIKGRARRIAKGLLPFQLASAFRQPKRG